MANSFLNLQLKIFAVHLPIYFYPLVTNLENNFFRKGRSLSRKNLKKWR